ncbi:GNAT family N-acetyltransferase [Nitrospirillum viridazoti]|uniref:Ribosomal protein S18 acetylase RimI-like enzyme n=1 Tax=Nitrospirillum amazonense TaxID=28077 RepID=A0A560I5U2_9PROT|nr:N-acetyltransferase [Nitrospirillum amazonense]TWB54328.1 ribosomal protein S18 acetylase RimI-like enzyme [Nitrospirillum amazonense]
MTSPAPAPASAHAPRPATPADLEALLALEKICFEFNRMGRRSFRRLLERPSAHILVIDGPDGTLAASAVLLSRRGTRGLRLYSLATHPDQRGRGLAKAMMQAALDRVRATGHQWLSLEVHPENDAARALYHRLGFRQTSVEEDYYADGSPAFRLRRYVDQDLTVGNPGARHGAS